MRTYTFKTGDKTYIIEALDLATALAEYRRQLKEAV
jgi:hypothetical protein